MTGRTVEDLQPGEVVVYEVDGVVLALTAVRPPRWPGDRCMLTYEVLRLPGGHEVAELEGIGPLILDG